MLLRITSRATVAALTCWPDPHLEAPGTAQRAPRWTGPASVPAGAHDLRRTRWRRGLSGPATSAAGMWCGERGTAHADARGKGGGEIRRPSKRVGCATYFGPPFANGKKKKKIRINASALLEIFDNLNLLLVQRSWYRILRQKGQVRSSYKSRPVDAVSLYFKISFGFGIAEMTLYPPFIPKCYFHTLKIVALRYIEWADTVRYKSGIAVPPLSVEQSRTILLIKL